MTTIISPSLLSADFSKLAEEVIALDRAGADMFHMDIMDGHFVPNITFGAGVMKSIRKYTQKPFDVHFMIENVDSFIPNFVEAGADRISIHVEGNIHLHRSLSLIKSMGVKTGVVINPSTPVPSIYPVIDLVDFVLIMSVNPGFGGQAFIESSINKISELRKFNNTIEIQVDGGITEQNAKSVIEAGANNLVAGTSILKAKDYAQAISSLRNPK